MAPAVFIPSCPVSCQRALFPTSGAINVSRICGEDILFTGILAVFIMDAEPCSISVLDKSSGESISLSELKLVALLPWETL